MVNERGTKSVDLTKDEDLTVGSRIRLMRIHKLKVEQGALGRLVGVSGMAVSKWERDENIVTEEHLRKLAEATGLTYEWFTTGRPISDRMAAIQFLASMVDDEAMQDIFEAQLRAHFDRVGKRFNGK